MVNGKCQLTAEDVQIIVKQFGADGSKHTMYIQDALKTSYMVADDGPIVWAIAKRLYGGKDAFLYEYSLNK